MSTRRYQVRVSGHRFSFSYNPEKQEYKFTFGDVLHQGAAPTVAAARRVVQATISAELQQ